MEWAAALKFMIRQCADLPLVIHMVSLNLLYLARPLEQASATFNVGDAKLL